MGKKRVFFCFYFELKIRIMCWVWKIWIFVIDLVVLKKISYSLFFLVFFVLELQSEPVFLTQLNDDEVKSRPQNQEENIDYQSIISVSFHLYGFFVGFIFITTVLMLYC